MISVIIPHMNQPGELDRCLAALTAQRTDLADVEIIVVDNGSTDRPEEIVAAYPGVRLIEEAEPGPGPARNRGVRTAKGEILAFIDADCVAGDGWLKAIDDNIGRRADILGGDVRILHADADNPTVWEAYESEFGYRMEHYIKRQNFTGTGNLATTRAIYDDVGRFAGIGLAEDRDWGHRATARGHAIAWTPEMTAYHPARKNFAELARKWDRHTAHDFAAFLGKPLGRLRWSLRTVAMTVSPLAVVPRVLRSDRISGGMRGKWRAFRGVVAIRFYRSWQMARLIPAPDGEALNRRWREGA